MIYHDKTQKKHLKQTTVIQTLRRHTPPPPSNRTGENQKIVVNWRPHLRTATAYRWNGSTNGECFVATAAWWLQDFFSGEQKPYWQSFLLRTFPGQERQSTPKSPMNHWFSQNRNREKYRFQYKERNLKPTTSKTPLNSCVKWLKGCLWDAHGACFQNTLWKVLDCGRISTSYAYWSPNVWTTEHISSEVVLELTTLLKRLSWVVIYDLIPLFNFIMSHLF